jgi:uncharacterized damage-inducible protein DinB
MDAPADTQMERLSRGRKMACSQTNEVIRVAIPTSTRTRLERQLDALPVIFDAANAGFADIPPDDGGWSASENVAHLARHAHVFLGRLDRLLREERPRLGSYRPEEDPEWPSWRSLSLDEALRRVRDARARLIVWVDGLSEGQAHRVGIHPVLGEMDVGRWVEFFLLHEAHHLYFAMRRLGQARTRATR